jgi:hypothetical protein
VSERHATLFLGTVERSLSVTHVVPAPPARVLRALGVVLQHAPYELQLRETLGAHPLDGGVIVFAFTGAVVGVMNASGGARAGNVNAYWMQTQQALEARQLQVTLRAVPGDPQRTEVTVTCDLRPGVRRNVRVSQWLAGTVGSGTGFFTGAVLAKGAAVALSPPCWAGRRRGARDRGGESRRVPVGLSRHREQGPPRDPRRLEASPRRCSRRTCSARCPAPGAASA